MELKIVHTDKAPGAVGPYSQAVLAGNILFLSGQIPINPATGELVKSSIEEETRQCLENAKAILEEAGTTLENVIKATVFIKDMDQFGRINEVYGQYFHTHYLMRRSNVKHPKCQPLVHKVLQFCPLFYSKALAP